MTFHGIVLISNVSPLISMLRIAMIAIIQTLHSYVILELSLRPTVIVSSSHFLIFYILLWITYGGAILLWKGMEDKDLKKTYGGLAIVYSPWVWLAIWSVLLYFGFLK